MKVDYKKELKHLYNASVKQAEIGDVPAMNFLMIDGEGSPDNSQVFQNAVETLFSISYTLKFMVKKGKEAIDYGVMPLEGLWWADDMSKFAEDKDSWKWTLMIMQPEYINKILIKEAVSQVEKKKGVLPEVRFETFADGKSVQMMHVGPFSEERRTVEQIHQFIAKNGFKLSGKHHEIYLSDIKKVAPEKWKTIIRQPITLT